MTLHLTQSWSNDPDHAGGNLTITLHNLGASELRAVSFCYTSVTRIDEDTKVRGGTVVRNEGSFVEIVPDAPLAAGGTWTLHLSRTVLAARTRTQGVLSAWIVLKSGASITATLGDLISRDGAERGPGKHWPAGAVTFPLALLPWPVNVAITEWRDAPVLCPAPGTDAAPFHNVAALHRRLFPADPAPISLVSGDGALPVSVRHDNRLPAAGYRLSFGADIILSHADDDGLRHGLIALAQMAHGARTEPGFRFPASGYIADHPRFGWRGCMLDVVRNFHPEPTVLRLLDVLAWLRMNRFHWHLTDDEGWRMPSEAYPALNDIGARRGDGLPMPSQYGDGPGGQAGFYTATSVARIVAHAASLGIEVMPEVEMPGHARSLLLSVEGLRDPDEPNGAYRSIQGHTNNALNPGLARTYEVTSALLDEAVALFPFDVVHVGADEVEGSAWAQSPAAIAFAAKHGLNDTAQMQAHFLRQMQHHLARRGRRIGAWDEAAEGGGIAPETALLFAWRTRERIAELILAGYDVVALPGQAYYLDMAEAPGWDARGMTWAGIAPPEAAYAYDVGDGLPDGPGRLVGVQAAIWTEYLPDIAAINAVAFPRLAAVAEAGWTPTDAKCWNRFCALSRLVPQL